MNMMMTWWWSYKQLWNTWTSTAVLVVSRPDKPLASPRIPDSFWGSPFLLFSTYRGPFLDCTAEGGMKLTNHLRLMPRLIMTGAKPPPLLQYDISNRVPVSYFISNEKIFQKRGVFYLRLTYLCHSKAFVAAILTTGDKCVSVVIFRRCSCFMSETLYLLNHPTRLMAREDYIKLDNLWKFMCNYKVNTWHFSVSNCFHFGLKK
jgi:hypothetical protein